MRHSCEGIVKLCISKGAVGVAASVCRLGMLPSRDGRVPWAS